MNPAPIRYMRDFEVVDDPDLGEYYLLHMKCGHSIEVLTVPDQNRARCTYCRAEASQ